MVKATSRTSTASGGGTRAPLGGEIESRKWILRRWRRRGRRRCTTCRLSARRGQTNGVATRFVRTCLTILSNFDKTYGVARRVSRQQRLVGVSWIVYRLDGLGVRRVPIALFVSPTLFWVCMTTVALQLHCKRCLTDAHGRVDRGGFKRAMQARDLVAIAGGGAHGGRAHRTSARPLPASPDARNRRRETGQAAAAASAAARSGAAGTSPGGHPNRSTMTSDPTQGNAHGVEGDHRHHHQQRGTSSHHPHRREKRSTH